MRSNGFGTHVSSGFWLRGVVLTTANSTGAACVIRMTWNWQSVPDDLTCSLKLKPPSFPKSFF